MPFSSEDRLAVHELLALHGHIADDRRPEDLHLLLTGDAVYDVSAYGMGEVVGLAALTTLHEARPGEQPVGHHVTNVVVTPESDDRARVRSKGLAVMRDGSTGTVVYDDVVVRTDAGWRLAHRRITPHRTD
jgi:hypothetical protein